MQDLIAHLEDGFSYPFRVGTFRPFPDGLYSAVLENLPDNSSYGELNHEDAEKGSRTALLLDGDAPPFWRGIAGALCGRRVEEIFRNHLGFEGPAVAAARLLRDFAGYRIKPHPDSSKKLCTVQFYLPRNGDQCDLGTSFYSRADDGSFVEEQKLPFLPNTGYCFKVTPDSWHGCDFDQIVYPRNTLILTYYKAK